MRNASRWFAPALAVALALGLTACGDDDDTADDGADAGATTTAAVDSTDGDSASSEADVTIVDFTFEPAELTVAPGATFTVVNVDTTAHTLTSDAGGIDVGLDPDESGEATAPSEAGEYEFYCRIHPSMTGTLTVA